MARMWHETMWNEIAQLDRAFDDYVTHVTIGHIHFHLSSHTAHTHTHADTTKPYRKKNTRWGLWT